MNKIIKKGIVVQALPNANFRVKLDDSDDIILCHLAGKMRIHHISVMPGDKVTVEMTLYDNKRGRITYRTKKENKNES